MSWRVLVALTQPGPGEFTRTWSFTPAADPDDDTADVLTVLDGLEFGWAMPDGPLWPLQPEPMDCQLMMSVPDFPELDNLTDGASLCVFVWTDAASDDLANFEFIGDVTDLDATPRGDQLPGVTLSLVAVDTSVRTRELQRPAGDFPAIDVLALDHDQLAILWTWWTGQTFQTEWWTTIKRTTRLPSGSTFRDVADQLLLQSTGGTSSGEGHEATDTDPTPRRMIVAPYVDWVEQSPPGPVNDPPTVQHVLDTIVATQAAPDPWLVPAAAVLRSSLRWSRSKGQRARYINTTGWGHPDFTTDGQVYTAEVAVYGDEDYISADVPVTFGGADDGTDSLDALYAAVATANLYAAPWARWRVQQLTILVDRSGIGPDVPMTLMPRHRYAPGTTERAAAYSAYVIVDDFPTPAHPTPAPPPADLMAPGMTRVEGVLVGARVRVEARRLELDVKLRTPWSAWIPPEPDPLPYHERVMNTADLAGYWRMGDLTSASQLTDSSTNGRHGAYQSTHAHPVGLVPLDPNTGLTGRAFIANAAWQNPLAVGLTAECLFSTAAITGTKAMWGKSNAGAFGTNNAGAWRLYFSAGSVVFQVFDTAYQPIFGLSFAAGTGVHHWAGTWDVATQTAKLYKDGSVVATYTNAGAPKAMSASNINLWFGSQGGSFNISGTDVLDECAMWPRALSAAEIAYHFDAITNPVAP